MDELKQDRELLRELHEFFRHAEFIQRDKVDEKWRMLMRIEIRIEELTAIIGDGEEGETR